jgi:predicted  nucleic acid-binding Zn-ribbon protein
MMKNFEQISISELANDIPQLIQSQNAPMLQKALDAASTRLDYRNTPENVIGKLDQELHRLHAQDNASLLLALEKLQQIYPPSQFHEEWYKTAIRHAISSGLISQMKTATRITLDLATRSSHGNDAEAAFLWKFRTGLVKEYLDLLKKSLAGQNAEIVWGGIETMDPTTKAYEEVVVGMAIHYPVDVLEICSDCIQNVETRLRASYLLGKLVTSDHVQIHQITNTKCLDILLQVLLTDSYAPLIALNLVTLTQLLPKIPLDATKMLSELFTIFLRGLLWETRSIQQLRSVAKHRPEDTREEDELMTVFAMRSLHRTVDMYFTHLYGMWPSNFMAFLQKHVGWMPVSESFSLVKPHLALTPFPDPLHTSIELEGPLSEGQVATIRQALEPILHNHTLFLPFISIRPEEELVHNLEKFKSTDPMEVVSQCLERRYRTSSKLDETRNQQDEDLRTMIDIFSKLSHEDKRKSYISMGSSPPKSPHKRWLTDALESETESIVPPVRNGVPNLEQVLIGYENLRGGRRMAPHMDPITRPMEDSDNKLPIDKSDVVRLQFYLLISELNLELYLRQVHLAWIRRLRRIRIRDQVKELDFEAEVERIAIAEEKCRVMQEELDRVTALQASPLEPPLPVLESHEQKDLQELERTREELKHTQTRVFALETELAWLKPKASRTSELETNMQQLTKQLIMWETDAQKKRDLEREKDQLSSQCSALKTQIESLQTEITNMKNQGAQLSEKLTATLGKLDVTERQLESMESRNKVIVAQEKTRQLMDQQREKLLADKYETIRALNLQLESRILTLSSNSSNVPTEKTNLSPMGSLISSPISNPSNVTTDAPKPINRYNF